MFKLLQPNIKIKEGFVYKTNVVNKCFNDTLKSYAKQNKLSL